MTKVEESYFFDTYALVEIVKGNSNYLAFKHCKIVLTIFNLAEFHYKVLRDFNKELADELLEEYEPFAVAIDSETIKESNDLKLLHRTKNLSSADVIGYITARRYGLKFLTGDRYFQDMAGVEFVK